MPELGLELPPTAIGKDYPVAGDWVLLTGSTADDSVVEAVLPRRTSLVRKAAGNRTEEQVVAAEAAIAANQNPVMIFVPCHRVLGADGKWTYSADNGQAAIQGLKAGETHPMIAAMNALPYQCGTLGNHEFNYGLSFMDKVLAGANFPFVCANLVRGTELAAKAGADFEAPRRDALPAAPPRRSSRSTSCAPDGPAAI